MPNLRSLYLSCLALCILFPIFGAFFLGPIQTVLYVLGIISAVIGLTTALALLGPDQNDIPNGEKHE